MSILKSESAVSDEEGRIAGFGPPCLGAGRPPARAERRHAFRSVITRRLGGARAGRGSAVRLSSAAQQKVASAWRSVAQVRKTRRGVRICSEVRPGFGVALSP